jgi:hypothetical protein
VAGAQAISRSIPDCLIGSLHFSLPPLLSKFYRHRVPINPTLSSFEFLEFQTKTKGQYGTISEQQSHVHPSILVHHPPRPAIHPFPISHLNPISISIFLFTFPFYHCPPERESDIPSRRAGTLLSGYSKAYLHLSPLLVRWLGPA